MKEYILTIDQGTSSSKVILYDTGGSKAAESTQSIHLIQNSNNYIEQDPKELLGSIQMGIKAVLDESGVSANSVIAVAIDNQGETIIPFRKDDLVPLYNSISWQDGRGEERIKEFKDDVELNNYIKRKTGLFSSSYFSASKMEWLIKNVGEVKKEMDNKNLLMATSEVWIINKLIKERQFKTDYTTASRTMLFDIKSLKWDERLVDFFHLSIDSMPSPSPTMDDYGVTDPSVCIGIEAPILVSIVDQQSSLVGHRCFREGEAKLTLGTGGFLQVNSGISPKNKSDLIVKSIFIEILDKISYVYEGQVYSVGSAIEWLKKNNMIDSYSEIDLIDDSKLSTRPFFIPALSGVAAPYWKSEPSAAFMGMGLQTTRVDLVHSVLESIAFRAVQIIRLIEKETGIEIKDLSVDGGVSKNRFILDTIAKLTGKKIIKSGNEDLTSLGCFYLASLKLGLVDNYEELSGNNYDSIVIGGEFSPSLADRFDKWERLFDSVVGNEGVI